STSCTSKKSPSFQSVAATRQARTTPAPGGPRRKAAAARSARLACVATAAACGACTGRSARPPGSIRCTAARRAAAAGGGARAGERLAIRTWVEDFRRVRSHRRYAVHGADGTPVLEALTDWVYVDVESGRPRRVPRELETAFGFAAGNRSEREAWSAPPAPPAPALGTHRVRACEVDSIGHVNNAVYLEVATQAVLDAIEDA